MLAFVFAGLASALATSTQANYTLQTLAGTATEQRTEQTASGTNRLQSHSHTYKAAGSNASQTTTQDYPRDASGSLTRLGSQTLQYNAQGRIAAATTAGGTSNTPPAYSYQYNSSAQRLLKTDLRQGTTATATTSTEAILYADDATGSTVLGQYSNQRSTTSAAPAGEADSTEVLWLPTASGPMPIAAQINGRLYAIDSDHLNTPRRLTNAQGQVVWQWLITGYGEVAPTTGATGYAFEAPQLGGSSNTSGNVYSEEVNFKLRYPGQVWDEETGLSYNLNRYYDGQAGRYIQSDPIGLDGGWNRFAYVSGNPLSFIDANGLKMYSDDFIGPLPRDGYRKSQMTKTRCGLVPPSPPGADIVQNMSVAKGQTNPLWFREMVKNKGAWDYKQQGSMYQDFGNFNYGASGRSFGFYRQTLLQEAGRAQQAAGTSRLEWGYPPSSRWDIYGGQPPYGDDPDDQEQIKNGADFCQCMGY